MIGGLFRTRAPLLPRDAGGEAWLAGLIAVLCFLACLAAVGAVSADRAAHGWARALRAEATVQVRPRVGETGAEAAARAAQTLAGLAGVAEAEAMDRETAEALLRPWVGDAVLPDLPIPYLVTVRLDQDAPASAVTLGRAMAEAGLDATIDDHSLWRGEVERSAGLITGLAAIAFLLTAGAAAAAVQYATRAGMAAPDGLIGTLRLNGAPDRPRARPFPTLVVLLAPRPGARGASVRRGGGGRAVGRGGVVCCSRNARRVGRGCGLVQWFRSLGGQLVLLPTLPW